MFTNCLNQRELHIFSNYSVLFIQHLGGSGTIFELLQISKMKILFELVNGSAVELHSLKAAL